MSQVNVLVAIDVQRALSQQNLGSCVFMEDTNGFLGSNQEGTSELITTCTSGDTIVWSVVGIDPATSVTINSFTGAAIPDLINPHQDTPTVWQGQVASTGNQVQYSMNLNVGAPSRVMAFDPFITSNAPPAAAKRAPHHQK